MTLKLNLPQVVEQLADVALLDDKACAAAGSMSTSKWLDLVRLGDAPQPVVRGPRYTRWRAIDVRAFLAALAERGSLTGSGPGGTHARQASEAARAKRRTATAAA